jgi:hypothetical protein
VLAFLYQKKQVKYSTALEFIREQMPDITTSALLLQSLISLLAGGRRRSRRPYGTVP